MADPELAALLLLLQLAASAAVERLLLLALAAATSLPHVRPAPAWVVEPSAAAAPLAAAKS